MHFTTCLLAVFVLFCGCTNNGEVAESNSTGNYARGFHLEERDGAVQLTIFNPWEKARNVSLTYYLVSRDSIVPSSLHDKNIITTPVERVICLSTTHLAYIEALGEATAVAGISGSRYISSPAVRSRMEAGLVPDVGYGQNLNYELIVKQKPDVVMLYGIGSEVTTQARKLEELGIPVIMVAEYLEETPLGKAEWIKFIGALFEKGNEAEAYFQEVVQEYQRLKELVSHKSQKPAVMVGSPYNDTWWVPGGNSYMANLIADAGGRYLGESNNAHESYVISFENALTWANMADVWINMGNLSSKREMMATDERFAKFRVFNQGRIFNNIERLSIHGGNDFWESGTVNPHLILQDLIAVFHPDLADWDFTYYREIK